MSRRLKKGLGPMALSLVAHAGLVAGLLTWQVQRTAETTFPPEPPVMPLILAPPDPPPPPPAPELPVETPKPADPAPAPKAPAPPAPAKAPPRPNIRAPRNPPPDVQPLPVAPTPTPAPPEPVATLTEAQAAGAITAGSGDGGDGVGGTGAGEGGRPCDMVRRIQAALRRDPEVRAAILQAGRDPSVGGRAMLVWNGDWIRTPGQEGKGLAGVRQAIMLEVAFAPEACKRQPVQGLVLLSMNEGGARVALGQNRWRWTDLLGANVGRTARR
ncbi:hypothetical protein [Phenylobacterium deserti]|uniref:Uncharacterized protein n=1 Tax=Phenylobacterium deserti TaxID=1914756 RepID=A0A328APQ6_9CAUL|nr:hypothetical protein [Phenylobacterium deserti]RAK56960.1 hypothetical protein DJ018_03045 [Phenylobacterium deserti]